MRTALRRSALAAAIIALPLGVVATPAAAGATPPEPPVIESLGDPATAVLLPPAPQVGQQGRNQIGVIVGISIDGESVKVGFDATADAEITAVTPDGGYTAHTTIVEMELSDASEGVDAGDFDLDELVGVQYEQDFSPSGAIENSNIVDLASMDKDAAALAEEFVASSQTVVISYPDEPVGVGAKWSSEVLVESDGFSVPVTYEFEITDITDGRYSMTLTYAADIDQDVQGASVTGTLTGGGTVTGSVDNLLDQALDLDQDMMITVGTGGDSMDMSMTVEIDTASSDTVPAGFVS